MADADDAGSGEGVSAPSGSKQVVSFTLRIVAALRGEAEAKAVQAAAVADAEAAGEAPPAATPFVPDRIPHLRYTFNEQNITSEPATEWAPAGAADGDEDGAGGGAGDADTPPCARVYEKAFTGVSVDRAWLEQLHGRSQLTLFIADAPGNGEGEPRKYAAHVMLDMSPLLDNDTAVSAEFAPLDGDNDGTEGHVALPSPPEGFDYFKVTVSVDKPLLTPQLVKELNPLAVTIKQAVDLPGVHMADGDPSLQRYVTPTPYHLMRKHCEPVFACFKFFDGQAIPRVVRTPGVPYGSRAVWNVKTVFLAGIMAPDQIRELIVQAPLCIEVHDRDVPLTEAEVQERRARWEGIVAGTYVDPEEEAARLEALAIAAEEEAARAAEEAANPLAGTTEHRRSSQLSSAAGEGGAGANTERTPQPVEVFVVDRMVEQELSRAAATAGDHNAHATASVRLDPLLERGLERLQILRRKEARRLAARAQSEMEARNADRMAMYEREVARCKAAGKPAPSKPALETEVPAPPEVPEDPDALMDAIAADLGPQKIKKSVDLVPAKRRVIPKGGVVNYDLTSEQRVTREPGAFTHNMSRLKVLVKLTRPLYVVPPKLKPAPLPFERAVFCMPYNNPQLLRSVLSVIKEVNEKQFPGVSIRSHQMEEHEMAAANAGTLDVITGFQLLDAKWRLLVVEGLSDGAMRLIHSKVHRSFANTATCTYLANPEIRFQHRIYTRFHLAPKDVRLRDPLSKLVEAPQIYDRAQVTSLTFNALYRLYEMRNCSRIVQAKTQRLFPSVDMLLEIENKYGDTVTVEDMTGRKPAKKKNRTLRTTSNRSATTTPAANANANAGSASALPHGATVSGEGVRFDATAKSGRKKNHHNTLSKADFTNPTFVKMQKERASKTVDFITMNKTAFPTGGGRTKTQSLDVEGKEPPGGEVYNYSGQRLNYAEWQKELMRQRLAQDKKSTYTYSKDFQSLTVCLVNEAEMEQNAKQASRARWTTQRGFVYPAPRDPEEFARHPKAPSASRKEELEQPWEEPGKAPLSSPLPDLPPDNRPRFDTVPVRGKTFGYVDAKGSHNPDFFKSVFLCGDGLAAEEAAVKKAEEDEWEAKVVVDNTRFTPHFTSKHPSQLHKLKGLLDGTPRHKGIRIVHKARLPSGKPTAPPGPAPASIFTGQDYEDPVDFTTTLKPNIKEDFLGTDAQGNKVEFYTHIHKDANKPKSWKAQYTRKHPALSDREKRGERWFPDIHKRNGGVGSGSSGKARRSNSGGRRRGSRNKK